MIGRERIGPIKNAEIAHLLLTQGHVIEQAALIETDPAAHVGLGQEREPVAPADATHLDGQPGRIFPVDQEVRHLMVADQGADRLTLGERDAHAPEDAASKNGSPA